MKDTTSNGFNVEQSTPGEARLPAARPFWPSAFALNSAIGGQVFARPHNKTVIRINSNKKAVLFVKLDHIFCDFEDFFAQRFRREDLDLVAVAEYPPGDFAQAVHAKFYGG